MSIFSFRGKKKFDRNYYGELCDKTRQIAILENTVDSLVKERDSLIKRLSAYEKVEPQTQVNLPVDDEIWVIPKTSKIGEPTSIMIGEIVESNKAADVEEDEYDVIYDANGDVIHEKDNKDSTRQAIVPITAIPPSSETKGAAGYL